MVPACSSGTLTNVLPHRNAMPQTQDMTPHPVTVYRHGADLSLCYPLMWNVTLEYTTTHFNVLGETRPGNPSPTFHTHQRTLNLMLLWWSTVGSSVESTVPTGSWTRDLWCANPVRYPLAHSDFLKYLWRKLRKFEKMFNVPHSPLQSTSSGSRCDPDCDPENICSVVLMESVYLCLYCQDEHPWRQGSTSEYEHKTETQIPFPIGTK